MSTNDDFARKMLETLEQTVAARLPRGDKLPFASFARRRLQIRDKLGHVVAFNINDVQKRYLATKRLALRRGKRPRFALLKSRRAGFTTVEQGLSYRLWATRRNQAVVCLTDVKERSLSVFRIARLFYKNDTEAPEIKGLGSSTRLETAQTNSLFHIGMASASAFGRGDTLQRVHGSEVSRWGLKHGARQKEMQKEVLDGLEEATSHGELVLETTPKGAELFHEIYMGAKKGENEYTPIFLPWFHDPMNVDHVESADEAVAIVQGMDDRERELVKLHGLSPAQLKWRRRAVRRLKKKFREEYPEDDVTCFMTSGDGYFDNDRVINLLESMPDYLSGPVEGVKVRELKGNGPVNHEVTWEEPEPEGGEYVLGCDTSEGLPDSHPNGVAVLNARTGKQAAVVYGRFDPGTLAGHVVRMHKKYCEGLIGVEQNNHGHAVLMRVMQLGVSNPRKLYHCQLARGPGGVNKAGFITNARTRPVLLADLRSAVTPDEGEGWLEVRDRTMLQQMLTFNRQADGEYDRDPGADDDTLFMWGIAIQMRRFWRPKVRLRTVQL